MLTHWDLVPATVVDRQNISHQLVSTNSRYKYVVELTTPDGEVTRLEMHDPHAGRPLRVRAPKIGEQITVKVRWKSRETKFNVDDPVLAHDPLAGAKAVKSRFAASLDPASGAGAASPEVGPRISISPGASVTVNGKRIGGPANVADDLQRLVTMHDKGLLNDAQFEAAKQKVLNA